jgi:hypothetical protein
MEIILHKDEERNCIGIFVDESRNSVVGIATGYGLDDQGVGVRVPVGTRIFVSCRADRLRGARSLLSNWYRGFSSGGKAAGA